MSLSKGSFLIVYIFMLSYPLAVLGIYEAANGQWHSNPAAIKTYMQHPKFKSFSRHDVQSIFNRHLSCIIKMLLFPIV